jgi:uncharacterized protein
MNEENAIRAFANAGHDLPRGAMRWALDNWDAAPGLLGLLEQFADGADRSKKARNAMFFILHLAGEKRDTRAFAPLCRVAQEGDLIETVLGDGITTTLKQIMISTYGGDLDTLKGVIEAEAADDFVRAGALQVLAYLAATGRVDRTETETYLLRLYDTLQPQHESFVWSGWADAVSLLGLEALSGIVQQAFRRGLIDPMVTKYEHFRKDLARTLADPERMAGYKRDRIAPLDDAIGELSHWHAFSEEAKRDQKRRALKTVNDSGTPSTTLPQSVIDPLKAVGRNDPCPCGSGKKYKKCCLT